MENKNSDFIFDSTKEYTYQEIYKLCTPVTLSDDGLILYADTPEREYVFKRSGHYWKLDHTWKHSFVIG